MKRDDWKVKEEGIRPAGPPDKCFYCKEPLGSQHKLDCVIRTRTVVIKVTIEMMREVVEDWSVEDIERYLNCGSWCANNIISDIEEQVERMRCICSTFYAKFVREATQKDEERFKLRVADCKS